MKKKWYICLSMTLALMVFLTAMNGLRRKEEALASRIAPKVLRFHVLANSDSPKDQALKLEVKDLLLDTIRQGLGSETERGPEQGAGNPPPEGPGTEAGDGLTKDQTASYILEHKAFLEETAEAYMKSRGFSYGADIRLEQCLFPEKTYGDMTFPAGTYDAVRVLLGEGKGKNFWCVLYPSLCYVDSTHAVVPEDSRDQLKALLPEDDFSALMRARHPSALRLPGHEKTGQKASEDALPRVTVRFKLAEILGRRN